MRQLTAEAVLELIESDPAMPDSVPASLAEYFNRAFAGRIREWEEADGEPMPPEEIDECFDDYLEWWAFGVQSLIDAFRRLEAAAPTVAESLM